jgi:Tol biopolymer transport system component
MPSLRTPSTGGLAAPSRRTTRTILLALCALLAACADEPTSPASSPSSLAKGGGAAAATVLFQSNQSGAQRIYMMNADGSNVRQLTSGPGVDAAPSYAPGNKKFVFVRKAAGADGGAIWTAQASGSKATQLTPASLLAANPEYSPDGTKIAFDGIVAADTKRAIFVMNADGTGVTQITGRPGLDLGNFVDPSWSPDGTQIVMARDGFGDVWSIATVDLPNGLISQLVECAPPGCIEPAWSPTGNRIAFTDLSERRLKLFEPGQQVVRIGNSAPGLGSPAWSRDGTHLFYHSDRFGTDDLFSSPLGDSDGSAAARLTSLGGNERGPSPSR